MHESNCIYNPITAAPFRKDSNYMEVIPCKSLRPYIKCFWGTKGPVAKIKQDIVTEELVIPDTCMDIIFDVNYTKDLIKSNFIGINDGTFKVITQNESTFQCSRCGSLLWLYRPITFIA